MPVTSVKALKSLPFTRSASSSRWRCDHSGLACTVQRSTGPRPGLDDSRASQAMRWCVLRAAFHCGPRCASVGCMACGNASISVQQGATVTAPSAVISGLPCCELSSSAWACGEGMAKTTASKPLCTRMSAPGPSVCSCQRWGSSLSASIRITWVCRASLPSAASGWAQ